MRLNNNYFEFKIMMYDYFGIYIAVNVAMKYYSIYYMPYPFVNGQSTFFIQTNLQIRQITAVSNSHESSNLHIINAEADKMA